MTKSPYWAFQTSIIVLLFFCLVDMVVAAMFFDVRLQIIFICSFICLFVRLFYLSTFI